MASLGVCAVWAVAQMQHADTAMGGYWQGDRNAPMASVVQSASAPAPLSAALPPMHSTSAQATAAAFPPAPAPLVPTAPALLGVLPATGSLSSPAPSASQVAPMKMLPGLTDIPLDDKSSVRPSIARILHDIEGRRVHIEMSATAKCASPIFLVRASGAALSTDFIWSTNGRIFTGQYSLCYPRAGSSTYFFEIMVLSCAGRAPYQGGRKTVMSTCLVDPTKNVLNLPYTFIDTPSARDAVGGPCWVSTAKTASQLTTRFQPVECYPYISLELPPSRAKGAGSPLRSIAPATKKLCAEYTDLTRFEPYKFDQESIVDWKQSWAPLGLAGTAAKPVVLCVFGDSHARVLAATMKSLIQEAMLSHTRVADGGKLSSKFLSELTGDGTLNQIVRDAKCTDVVLNMGQWSSGWPNHYPDIVKTIQEDLTTVVSHLGKLKASGALRSASISSVNYNPTGAMIAACPPEDWRSRPFIDAYNRAFADVIAAEPEDVVYIDSGFIVSPVWDSASDWCHYRGKVAVALAQYTLHRMAGGSPPLPPAPPPAGALSVAKRPIVTSASPTQEFQRREQDAIARGLTPIPWRPAKGCGAFNIGGRHGWPVCPKLLENPNCVVYAVGIGMFPEFDAILADKYGCEVHSFDPSPTGRDAIAKLKSSGKMPPNMRDHDLGISDRDGELTVYASLTGVMFTKECTERNVDASANKTCADSAVTFPVKTIATVMKELGHTHLTMLKVDTEGGEEHDFMEWSLSGVLARVDAVCAEFHYYSTFGYGDQGDKPTLVWDGPNGGYADGLPQSRQYPKGQPDKKGNLLHSFANAKIAKARPGEERRLVSSSQLQVVNDLAEQAGLKMYTNGYENTRAYLGATLAEACWGR
jgi:FkbM family methyltransferase